MNFEKMKEGCSAAFSRYAEIIMTIRAIIHKAEEGGFWAEVPALPGCMTQGETMDELRANLHEAVELWLEAGDAEVVGNREDQILEMAF